MDVLILYLQIWLNCTKMLAIHLFVFLEEKPSIISCVKIGSALKLARRRLETGQCIVSMLGNIYCLCIFYITH